MVRKHHAWKLSDPELAGVQLVGEDIYGVHSIEYDPVPETRTFYAFASCRQQEDETTVFDAFADTVKLARRLDVAPVPVLFTGRFETRPQLEAFLAQQHQLPSSLGGKREGMVIRTAGSFPEDQFHRRVAKSVRPNHVQTDQHWRRNWRPCRICP